MDDVRWFPVSDTDLLIEFGGSEGDTPLRLEAVARALRSEPALRNAEVVSAYASILVSGRTGDPSILQAIPSLAAIMESATRIQAPPRTFVVPVVYGGEYGPDLDALADGARLSVAEVVDLHTQRHYVIRCLGFAPGFAYLDGLDPRLHVARRASPRPRVAPGSVGIGGSQTGVYPGPMPGGWQIIGRTPCVLFDPKGDPPVPFAPGDVIRFRPIEPEEFERLEALRPVLRQVGVEPA